MKKPNILVPVMAFSLAFLNKLCCIFILHWALQITQTTQPATFFHTGCMPRSSFSLCGMIWTCYHPTTIFMLAISLLQKAFLQNSSQPPVVFWPVWRRCRPLTHSHSVDHITWPWIIFHSTKKPQKCLPSLLAVKHASLIPYMWLWF